jgi:hypothetical protein
MLLDEAKETMAWDGTNWIELASVQQIQCISSWSCGPMEYDTVRKNMIFLDRGNSTRGIWTGIMEWDGSVWRHRDVTTPIDKSGKCRTIAVCHDTEKP